MNSPPLIRAPELSIVVPTFNERDNVPVLIERLRTVLADTAWEIIIVDDDSPDGTADAVHEMGAVDTRVRCIRRVGRRGLSGACLEGMLASQGRFVAVMDADLQHDEKILPTMLAILRNDEADVVVGSRYAPDGLPSSFTGHRRLLSRLANWIARSVFGLTLTDPMSGFFVLKRSIPEKHARNLSTQGFKILLDILTTAGPATRIAEVPFHFGERYSGESKLDARVMLDYLGLVLSKATFDLISLRFVFFCLVGISGIGVHFAVLTTAIGVFWLPFDAAQILATLVAIGSNFILNNTITYRDQRLRGSDFFRGMLQFYLISSVGVISNISVSSWMLGHQSMWWAAGFGGALMSVIWNYVITSLLVWRRR